MAKTDINENIYRAIDTIIDARLQNVNFNSTVLCTIVDDSKAASGIFTVDNLGVQFQATSMDKSFKVNDQVYVTVPNNNFDAQKIIIGKKEDLAELQEQWKDPFNYLEFKYQFDEDSDEVEIIPTGNGQASNEMVKRIILDDDFDRTINLTSSLQAPGEGNAGTLPWDAEEFTEDCLWVQTARAEEPHTVLASYRQNINFKEFKRFTEIGWSPFSLQFSATSPNLFRALLYYKNNNFNKEFYQIVDLPQQKQIPISGKLPNGFSYWQEPTPYTYYYSNDDAWILSSIDSRREMPFYITEGNNNDKKNLHFLLFYNEKQYRPISLAGLKNIVITVDIQSDITFLENAPSVGSYKLQCQLIMVHQNDSTNEKTLTMTIASDTDFLGDPYNYFDYFTQQVVFDITNYQDYIVNKIEFSVIQNGNFTNIDSGTIKIKNPKIYFGLPLKETELGYAGYKSIFRTNSKYYQKLTLYGVLDIFEKLRKIPPEDTELDTEGPFDYRVGGIYRLTNDTSPKEGKTYYHQPNGGQPYSPAPENPKEAQAYEYVEEITAKRYLPKLFFKANSSDKIPTVIKDNFKYYDQLLNYNYYYTTHDWAENKYYWNSENEVWHLISGQEPSDDYPETLEPYVCYLPGKQIASYFGAIETNNTTPQVGISSSEQNIDVTLASSASSANVVLEAYNNRNITLQGNEDIIINNNNKSQIKISEDLLLIKNINNGNGNGIKLSNNPPDNLTNKGEVTVRLGYTDGQPAINISIQNNTGTMRRNLIIIANSDDGFIINTDNNDLPITFAIKDSSIGKLRCFINDSEQPQINFAMFNDAGGSSSVAFTKTSVKNLADLLNHYQNIKNNQSWS